ncbi:hypothetical protein ACIBLA_34630 [Streptomyces sp. NPDC050433]|uniref:hypothetical protein n=1 Tax=unclassified Streptomyces TaxID=2593676 RepID=UPI0034431761
MGLLSAVLISLVFPALMLLITVGLGRMEEFLLPHLRAPRPADGDSEAPSENSAPEDGRAKDVRADARVEAVRRSARRRAYGTPRPVGRTNTGPPRGARTTPLRFR